MATAQSTIEALPPLREELRLMGRSKDVGGEAVWLIFDPLRNRYLELRPLAYEILSRWKLGSVEAVLDAIRTETRYHLTHRELGAFIAYLNQNQLLRRVSSPVRLPHPGWAGKIQKSLSSIVFFRIRLVRPDKFLGVMADALDFAFSRWFWMFVTLAGLSGLALVTRQWDEFLTTFAGFLDLQGVAVLLAAIVISKIVHELGHALTAKRYGCRVPVMGLAFILGAPLAYTDVSDTWRLEKNRERLFVSSAGILAETVLAVIATWGWLILPDSPARTACFVLASTGWIGTLVINLNPFMRFDGYYILSDALGIRNLQGRSFAMGKWGLRRFVLGWPGPAPETTSRRFRTFLMGFAWLTWTVRAIIFASLALLAYIMFGKPFGIIMGGLEVWLLLVQPVVKEIGIWVKGRKAWLGQKRARRMMMLLGILLVFALVPQSFRLSMPGVLAPQQRLIVHAPQTAMLIDYPTQERAVKKGDTIFRLTSPELQQDIGQSRRRLGVIKLAIEQSAVSQVAARQLSIFEEQLSEEQARLDGLLVQQTRLSVAAPFSGTITDINPDLSSGRWINPDQPLFLLVDSDSGKLNAYVDDRNRALIEIGSAARFYPEASDYSVLDGVIVDVQSVPVAFLDEPLLASLHGGDIPVREDAAKQLAPEHGLYQVTVKLTDRSQFSGSGVKHVMRGRVYADSKPYSLAGHAFNRVRSLFSREAGY
ncbi:site-2 protease family protein [Magnetovibrio sp.]|uniref:site-2 protease family protein n=1 Tax=Magnetovibrio sp. TaxID=2024836 RepID=UPI002F925AE5